MNKIIKIDKTTRAEHTYLTKEDLCYFALNYTANESFDYSDANSLIQNFKKSPDRIGQPEWYYKERAIKRIAGILKQNISPEVLKKVTLVPIPPSKDKNDPLYDDRMVAALNEAFGRNGDIRELLIQLESKEASHKSEIRPGIDELYENLDLDEALCEGMKDNVILFDDVITTGAHFKACQKRLLEYNPDLNILGVFIARREIKEEPEPAE